MTALSYIEKLRRMTAERQAQRAKCRPSPPRPLEERIQDWMDSSQQADSQETYTMAELVALYCASANVIGPALHKLGWRRRRSWRSDGPYGRHWLPPVRHAEQD